MIFLQDLCLSAIAEEFERFYFAFVDTNKENDKRNLEFLLRMYSSELASNLFKRGKLEDEYMDLLLNKHLNYLDEQWLEKTRYQNSMKDIFCHIPNLTEIDCLKVDNEILENVAKFCPKIVKIYAQVSSFTDHGVKHLCKNDNGKVPCPKLKRLPIRNSLVTEKGLAHLILNLKSLEELDHENVSLALYFLHKEDLPKLENVPSYNLVKLNFSYTTESLPYYKDSLKICLTVCPKLKSLSCSISNKEQLNLFNNTSLEDLNIKFFNQKINIDNFLKNCCSNLTHFTVFNCIMEISQLSVSCPKLTYLFLADVTFPDDYGDSKAVFHSLVSCVFWRVANNRATDKAINLILLSSPNLEMVTFGFCDFSLDRKISFLKCCEKCSLELIFFDNNRVELSFLKDILFSCPSLITLNLRNCYYSFQERNEIVQAAETLSNKPRIVFTDF